MKLFSLANHCLHGMLRSRSKWVAGIGAAAFLATCPNGFAQPTLVDPKLDVRTVVSGLATPTSMAFLGENDLLVLEKASGKVQRVIDAICAKSFVTRGWVGLFV